MTVNAVCVSVVYVADIPVERGVDGYDVVLCNASHYLPDAAVDLCKWDWTPRLLVPRQLLPQPQSIRSVTDITVISLHLQQQVIRGLCLWVVHPVFHPSVRLLTLSSHDATSPYLVDGFLWDLAQVWNVSDHCWKGQRSKTGVISGSRKYFRATLYLCT